MSPLQIVLSKLESRVIPEPPHWNSEAWRQVIHGPALALCQSAQAAGLPANRCASMVEAYLSMAREAVILGWLMPAGVERISFFQTAWTELIPRLLPQAHPDLHGVILGTLWTLADNLMDVPPWLELLIVHASRDLDDLEIVEAWVEDLILTALEPPAADLYGASPEPCWVDLSQVDWRFLPGSVQFVSPTVAWIGDRARRDGLKRPLGIGLWLPPSGPQVLGLAPPPEDEPYEPTLDGARAVLDHALAADHRFTEVEQVGSTIWRVVATMRTSQSVIVLAPGR